MGMIARCEFTRFDTWGIIKVDIWVIIKFRVSLCILTKNENEKLSVVPKGQKFVSDYSTLP